MPITNTQVEHTLVSSNVNSVGEPPAYLLGTCVTVVSEDLRLGLVKVRYWDYDSFKFKELEVNKECLECVN